MRVLFGRSTAVMVGAVAVVGVGHVGPVSAQSAYRIDFAAIPDARYGSEVTVKGKVTTIGGGLGLGATDVRLTFDPIQGATRTVTVRTSDDGSFAVRHNPRVRTAVRAVASGSFAANGPSASSLMLVEAPVRCALDAPRPDDGAWVVPGRCAVKGLHPGTKYVVQVRDGGVWRNEVRGRAPADRFRFVLDLPRRGTHTVRVFVLPGPKWLPTPSDAFSVRI